MLTFFLSILWTKLEEQNIVLIIGRIESEYDIHDDFPQKEKEKEMYSSIFERSSAESNLTTGRNR